MGTALVDPSPPALPIAPAKPPSLPVTGRNRAWGPFRGLGHGVGRGRGKKAVARGFLVPAYPVRHPRQLGRWSKPLFLIAGRLLDPVTMYPLACFPA